MAKRCLVPGCHRKLTDGRRHSLCASHWRQLPLARRRAIWGAWNETQVHGVEPSPEFVDAVDQAINHLVQKDP